MRRTAPKLALRALQPIEHMLYVDMERHQILESIRASAEKCEPVIRALLNAVFSFLPCFLFKQSKQSLPVKVCAAPKR